MGSSKGDLLILPGEVKKLFGFALGLAQNGEKHSNAKPLKGYGSAGVLEVVEDYQRSTFRAIYTIKFEKAVYALHVFKKKSRSGVSTPRPEMELVNRRLRQAELHYEEWCKLGQG